MNATRLLVLGVVRIMAPVHGYDVRRELLTWRLEELANVKPGSIYGSLRTLEKDGCIAVHNRESADSRPERTTYVLTGEGEKEFQLLLRESWWTVTAAGQTRNRSSYFVTIASSSLRTSASSTPAISPRSCCHISSTGRGAARTQSASRKPSARS